MDQRKNRGCGSNSQREGDDCCYCETRRFPHEPERIAQILFQFWVSFLSAARVALTDAGICRGMFPSLTNTAQISFGYRNDPHCPTDSVSKRRAVCQSSVRSCDVFDADSRSPPVGRASSTWKCRLQADLRAVFNGSLRRVSRLEEDGYLFCAGCFRLIPQLQIVAALQWRCTSRCQKI
jgi:hypothetical protein